MGIFIPSGLLKPGNILPQDHKAFLGSGNAFFGVCLLLHGLVLLPVRFTYPALGFLDSFLELLQIPSPLLFFSESQFDLLVDFVQPSFLTSKVTGGLDAEFLQFVADGGEFFAGLRNELSIRIMNGHGVAGDKEGGCASDQGKEMQNDGNLLHDQGSGANGKAVWDLSRFDFLENEAAPDSVNASLWRLARLNRIHGLFEVTDRVYQVRGFDLANMTIIEGETGVILVDPLTVCESAAAALKLYREQRGDRPVVAVI